MLNEIKLDIRDGVLVGYHGKGHSEIRIPPSVTRIEERVFAGHGEIERIFIPKTLFSIADNAFAECDNLYGIIVDEKNCYYHTHQGVLYSKDMSTLIFYPPAKVISNFVVPDATTTIGQFAFRKCKHLVGINLNNVRQVFVSAFEDCHQLYSVHMANVVIIQQYAFQRCHRLTNLKLPDELRLIGRGAFSECWSLAAINIPDNVQTIYDITFKGCLNLRSVTFGKFATTIQRLAFKGCPLASVRLPRQVENLDPTAFDETVDII